MNNFKKLLRFVIILLLTLPFLLLTNQCQNERKEMKQTTEIASLRMSIARLNIFDQRVIFSSLPAEYKYALWEDHYQDHLIKTKEADRKVFIQSMIDLLAVEDYADTAFYSTPKSTQLTLKVDEALVLYKNDSTKVAELLFMLGTGDQHVSLLASSGHLHDCNCSTKKDWCWDTCLAAECNTSGGCGTSGLYTCDGMCTEIDD